MAAKEWLFNAVRLQIDVDGKKKLLSAIDTHHKMQLKQANAQYMWMLSICALNI